MEGTGDMNESGTKNLTKNNWYYFKNVIKINDIETDETREDEKDKKLKRQQMMWKMRQP